MSIQDDIYDIEQALGDCPTSKEDLKTFARITTRLIYLENVSSEMATEIDTLVDAIEIVRKKKNKGDVRDKKTA